MSALVIRDLHVVVNAGTTGEAGAAAKSPARSCAVSTSR